MAKTTYIVDQLPPEVIKKSTVAEEKYLPLLDTYVVNSTFSQKKHIIEAHFYTLDGNLLYSEYDYIRSSELLNAKSAGKDGAGILSIDPVEDAIAYGFNTGDVVIYYNFLDDLLSEDKIPVELTVVEISSDRTEIKAILLKDSIEDYEQTIDSIQANLLSTSDFTEYKLNFFDNNIITGVNIDTQVYRDTKAVILKTSRPLPESILEGYNFLIQEEVSDSVAFRIVTEVEEDLPTYIALKGPNFDIELKDETYSPTQYYNFNELFSFPITNSYYELRSLFSEQSAEISIDHTDFSSFVHFSSAEERLANFKYKLDLIHSYQDYLNATGSITVNQDASGSRDYYEILLKGVVDNFDHYDRFLYYESGSSSWPKSNDRRPYINKRSTEAESINWYSNKLASASLYDLTNSDSLSLTVPSFIREDENNTPYLIFLAMIGQHFDNIWIYQKAVTDKYDADNRLSFGISKDLVREAIENFGVKLYESNEGLDNLFSVFTGETLITGSEHITQTYIATSGSDNHYLQPMPKDNYSKEIYKRIYHNLPLLLKTKGTERGLRALISCYGIPLDILSIKTFGGVNSEELLFVDPYFENTSSLDKVRLLNTGSIVQGDTLSRYTSIVRRDDRFTQDIHTVEIGFSSAYPVNTYLKGVVSSNFHIDDFIGDPRDYDKPNYPRLDKYSRDLTEGITEYNVNNLVRLVKFFDNSLFRIVREFVPARANVNTGIIVKPHILDRSKAKGITVSLDMQELTGSINMVGYSASHGDTFGARDQYNTSYIRQVSSQYGLLDKADHNQEEPKFNGEFEGSELTITDGELNRDNPYKKQGQPIILYDLTFIQELPSECQIRFTVIEVPAITPTPTATPAPTPGISPTPTPSVVVRYAVDLYGPVSSVAAACLLTENPVTYYHNGSYDDVATSTRVFLTSTGDTPFTGGGALRHFKYSGGVIILDGGGYLAGLGVCN